MSTEKQATDNVEGRAERIAADASDVRERTRKAFVETVRNRDISLKKLDETARRMMQGAVEGAKQLAPTERDSVLRQVIDGLADGVATTANAARYAFEEARSRGEQFARQDVERMIDNLRDVQERFVDTVSDAAHRAGSQIGIQTGALRDHLRRAFESARPAIESATRAAISHPIRLAGETATTGAHALPRAVGTVLHALSGALQGAGDLLTGEETEEEESATKSAAPRKSKSTTRKPTSRKKKKAATKKTRKKVVKKPARKKKATRKRTAKKSRAATKTRTKKTKAKKKPARSKKKSAGRKPARKKPAAKKASKKKKAARRKTAGAKRVLSKSAGSKKTKKSTAGKVGRRSSRR